MHRDNLTTILALIVATVWAIVAISSLVIQEYSALTAVTPVMLVVAGFLFGVKGGHKNGNTEKQQS